MLHDKGAALFEGQPQEAFNAAAAAYIPPVTHHNAQNTRAETRECVYVVAPAASRQPGDFAMEFPTRFVVPFFWPLTASRTAKRVVH